MRFSDVVSIISGGTPKTTTPSYWGGTIPWLSIKDFVSVNSYVYSTEKTITEEGLNNSPCNLLKKDDIIISARGTVGQIALIPYDMAFNQSCYGLRSNGKVSSKYLFYWLKGNKDKLLTNVHGAVFDTITKNTFDNIEIELPGPSIERHIVDTKCYSSLSKIARIFLSSSAPCNINSRSSCLTFTIAAWISSSDILPESSMPTYLPGTRE